MARHRKASFDINLLNDDPILENARLGHCSTVVATPLHVTDLATTTTTSSGNVMLNSGNSALDHLEALGPVSEYDTTPTSELSSGLIEEQRAHAAPAPQTRGNDDDDANVDETSFTDEHFSRFILEAVTDNAAGASASEAAPRKQSWGGMSDLSCHESERQDVATAVTCSTLHNLADDVMKVVNGIEAVGGGGGGGAENNESVSIPLGDLGDALPMESPTASIASLPAVVNEGDLQAMTTAAVKVAMQVNPYQMVDGSGVFSVGGDSASAILAAAAVVENVPMTLEDVVAVGTGGSVGGAMSMSGLMGDEVEEDLAVQAALAVQSQFENLQRRQGQEEEEQSRRKRTKTASQKRKVAKGLMPLIVIPHRLATAVPSSPNAGATAARTIADVKTPPPARVSNNSTIGDATPITSNIRNNTGVTASNGLISTTDQSASCKPPLPASSRKRKLPPSSPATRMLTSLSPPAKSSRKTNYATSSPQRTSRTYKSPMSPPGTSSAKGQSNQKWDDMFECLLVFIKEKREDALSQPQVAGEEWEWDGNVPTTYKTKDGKALGRWINNQRSAKHKGVLKKERELRLVSTGLKWSVLSTNSWTDMMNELRIYVKDKTKDGKQWDGNVPTNYRIKSNTAEDGSEIDEEKNLGRWINRQRSLFQCGKLKKDRQKDLEEIGLKWSVLSTSTWQSMYDALQDYVKMKREGDAHGQWDGNVPANYKTSGTPPKNLGRWVNRQRSAQAKNKLKDEYVVKLQSLGLKWTMHEKKEHVASAALVPTIPPLGMLAPTELPKSRLELAVHDDGVSHITGVTPLVDNTFATNLFPEPMKEPLSIAEMMSTTPPSPPTDSTVLRQGSLPINLGTGGSTNIASAPISSNVNPEPMKEATITTEAGPQSSSLLPTDNSNCNMTGVVSGNANAISPPQSLPNSDKDPPKTAVTMSNNASSLLQDHISNAPQLSPPVAFTESQIQQLSQVTSCDNTSGITSTVPGHIISVPTAQPSSAYPCTDPTTSAVPLSYNSMCEVPSNTSPIPTSSHASTDLPNSNSVAAHVDNSKDVVSVAKAQNDVVASAGTKVGDSSLLKETIIINAHDGEFYNPPINILSNNSAPVHATAELSSIALAKTLTTERIIDMDNQNNNYDEAHNNLTISTSASAVANNPAVAQSVKEDMIIRSVTNSESSNDRSLSSHLPAVAIPKSSVTNEPSNNHTTHQSSSVNAENDFNEDSIPNISISKHSLPCSVAVATCTSTVTSIREQSQPNTSPKVEQEDTEYSAAAVVGI